MLLRITFFPIFFLLCVIALGHVDITMTVFNILDHSGFSLYNPTVVLHKNELEKILHFH